MEYMNKCKLAVEKILKLSNNHEELQYQNHIFANGQKVCNSYYFLQFFCKLYKVVKIEFMQNAFSDLRTFRTFNKVISHFLYYIKQNI